MRAILHDLVVRCEQSSAARNNTSGFRKRILPMVVVERVSNEHRVFVINDDVRFRRQKTLTKRCSGEASETAKSIWIADCRTILVIAFVVEEEERLVLLDWTTHSAAELPAIKWN